MDEARCLGKGALFFLDDDDKTNGRPAKEICSTCPVKVDCLDYAVRTNIEHGIWGGQAGSFLEWVRRRYNKSIAEDNPLIYRDAMLAVFAELDVWLGKPGAKRIKTPHRKCEHCSGWIRAGRWPIDRNKPNAKCGKPAAYNKGCRCDPCRAAKSEADRKRKSRRKAKS